ncbi:MAG: NUDIX hydrolase, partial [Propionivibrio sp.]
AGFMENGESTSDAALRETLEEACARIAIDELFALINIPGIDQVHLFYRGRLLDAGFAAGAESLEALLFREEDIPWQELAFRSVTLCLRHYFADRHAGRFGMHEATLPPASPVSPPVTPPLTPQA